MLKREFPRYLAVSVIALGVDVLVLYIGVVQVRLSTFVATAVGYTVGSFVHYLLSIRYVFAFRRLSDQRCTELVAYWATGIVGLLMSVGAVHAGAMMALSLASSKTIAIVSSFFAVFLIRKFALFSNGN